MCPSYFTELKQKGVERESQLYPPVSVDTVTVAEREGAAPVLLPAELMRTDASRRRLASPLQLQAAANWGDPEAERSLELMRDRLGDVATWHLFLDFDKQGKGRIAFEDDETGYYDGMMRCMLENARMLGKRMTLDDVGRLHGLATRGVKMRNAEAGKATFNSIWWCNSEGYSASVRRELRQAAVVAFTADWLWPPMPCTFVRYEDHPLNSSKTYVYAERLAKWHDLGPTIFQARAETYYRHCRDAEELPEPGDRAVAVLAAIAAFLRDFDMSHYFEDGNGRLTQFILLTKLLLENGFPLCILKRPRAFFAGGNDTPAMVRGLLEGMRTFQVVQRRYEKGELSRVHSHSQLREVSDRLHTRPGSPLPAVDPRRIFLIIVCATVLLPLLLLLSAARLPSRRRGRAVPSKKAKRRHVKR